ASFTQAGTYTFTLTATNGCGSLADPTPATVIVTSNGTTPTGTNGTVGNPTLTGCNLATNPVSTALMGTAQGTITSWLWAVSPTAGVTIANSASRDTTASFTQAGTYTFTLTATNGCGSL